MTDLTSKLQPVITKVTEQLAAEITPIVHAAVRDAMLAWLDGGPPAPKPVAKAKRKPAPKPSRKAKPKQRHPKPVKVEGTTAHGKPRQRPKGRCGKCGALGFRSDGCGTSHQPSREDEDEATPSEPKPPVDAARAARFAAIEQSMAKRNGLPAPRSSFTVGG